MPGQWCRNFLQMRLFSPHLIPFSFNFLLFAVISIERVKFLAELTHFFSVRLLDFDNYLKIQGASTEFHGLRQLEANSSESVQ